MGIPSKLSNDDDDDDVLNAIQHYVEVHIVAPVPHGAVASPPGAWLHLEN